MNLLLHLTLLIPVHLMYEEMLSKTHDGIFVVIFFSSWYFIDIQFRNFQNTEIRLTTANKEKED